MKRITQCLTGAAIVVGLAAPRAIAAAHPDYVRVRSITYAGSGCPAGSVAENVSSDLQAFTLIFDSYIAQAGPGVPVIERRKNCQITLDLDFPSGWSFTVADIDYRGYVALERGVKGLQKSTYYFQGSAAQASGETMMRGEVDKDYQIRDELLLVAEVWSPCGAHRALNVNSQVRIDNSNNPRASGLLTVDSIDGTFKTIFNLKWQRCR